MNIQWIQSAIAWVVLAILCIVPPGVNAIPEQPRNEVAFYVEAYGEVVPESDDKVALAHRVFQRVRAVADKNSKRRPKLIVGRSRYAEKGLDV
ncbi:MAG: hypothetical protein ABFS45_27820 [Pseudomonadota bacterium]